VRKIGKSETELLKNQQKILFFKRKYYFCKKEYRKNDFFAGEKIWIFVLLKYF